MSSQELDEYFKAADEIARKACEMIAEASKKEKRVEMKDSVADLVTETDQKVERMIISTLKDKFPSHCFIGEESVAAGAKCVLTDAPTWIIDPVDGTNNFVHNFPFVAVSIALMINKQAEIGIVYNPMLHEMYSARRGQGAFCNGTPLQCTDTKDLSQALIASEFGSARETDILDKKFGNMRRIVENSHGIRACGSAALGLCSVACGRVDAFYEFGMHVWDIAAGNLIVQEAGGIVLDYNGGPVDLMSRRVLGAGTHELGQQIGQILQNVEFERD